jgi:hypothetical protein
VCDDALAKFDGEFESCRNHAGAGGGGIAFFITELTHLA